MYINYVGGGGGVGVREGELGSGGFYKFFKKYFVAQGIIEPNIHGPVAFL